MRWRWGRVGSSRWGLKLVWMRETRMQIFSDIDCIFLERGGEELTVVCSKIIQNCSFFLTKISWWLVGG